MPISDKHIKEIANMVIDAVGLKHISIDELSDDSKLIEPPLELDSVDVLEVVAATEDKYGVHITDAKEGAKHFQSLQTISSFINAK